MSNSNSNSPSHSKSQSLANMKGFTNSKSRNEGQPQRNNNSRRAASGNLTLIPVKQHRPSHSSVDGFCTFHEDAEGKPQQQIDNLTPPSATFCNCNCHSTPHPKLSSSVSTDSLSGPSNSSRPNSPESFHGSSSELEAAYAELQKKYDVRKQREHDLRNLLNTVLNENAMLKNKVRHLENIFTEMGQAK